MEQAATKLVRDVFSAQDASDRAVDEYAASLPEEDDDSVPF